MDNKEFLNSLGLTQPSTISNSFISNLKDKILTLLQKDIYKNGVRGFFNPIKINNSGEIQKLSLDIIKTGSDNLLEISKPLVKADYNKKEVGYNLLISVNENDLKNCFTGSTTLFEFYNRTLLKLSQGVDSKTFTQISSLLKTELNSTITDTTLSGAIFQLCQPNTKNTMDVENMISDKEIVIFLASKDVASLDNHYITMLKPTIIYTDLEKSIVSTKELISIYNLYTLNDQFENPSNLVKNNILSISDIIALNKSVSMVVV